MQISNNTTAFNVWKNYKGNVDNLQASMAKLSSGSRIDNAGDDPSGLAMSERLRTQSRNTSAAASNVENKLNYLQTSDSWMQKMHDMLGRMGELAVMANDGTKSDVDRTVLQQEFAQMQDEIARITTGSNAAGKFNGIALFQGGTGITQQVGADGGQTFTSAVMDLSTANADDLGSGTTWGQLVDSAGTINISDQINADAAVTDLQLGIDYLSQKRADVGAEISRMDQTLAGLRSYEENIVATESRIRDVDVAKETAEMTKYQILQQVGTAMLAQANQLPNNVMQLFG
ncbi:flagellin [Pontiellaceae bacterium B1224]|nr:flagellin [Pontiellaceae bacterium B1224]